MQLLFHRQICETNRRPSSSFTRLLVQFKAYSSSQREKELPAPAWTGPGRKKTIPHQKQAAKEAIQASATQSQLIPSSQTSKRAKKRVKVVSSSEDE